jgi:hypothetical protein
VGEGPLARAANSPTFESIESIGESTDCVVPLDDPTTTQALMAPPPTGSAPHWYCPGTAAARPSTRTIVPTCVPMVVTVHGLAMQQLVNLPEICTVQKTVHLEINDMIVTRSSGRWSRIDTVCRAYNGPLVRAVAPTADSVVANDRGLAVQQPPNLNCNLPICPVHWRRSAMIAKNADKKPTVHTVAPPVRNAMIHFRTGAFDTTVSVNKTSVFYRNTMVLMVKPSPYQQTIETLVGGH